MWSSYWEERKRKLGKKKEMKRQKELKSKTTKNEFIVNMLQAIYITLFTTIAWMFWVRCFSFHEFGALCWCMRIFSTPIRAWRMEYKWKSDDLYPCAFYLKHSFVKVDEYGALLNSLLFISSLKDPKEEMTTQQWKVHIFLIFFFLKTKMMKFEKHYLDSKL